MFSGRIMLCFVNLCVCYEIEFVIVFVLCCKWIVVVGVGLVGFGFVVMVVECGYVVMLYEVGVEIGG